MTIHRVPLINELLSISVQAAQGTPATPATGDITTYLKCDLNPDIENIKRSDMGLGRSDFGYVAGGKQTAKWSCDLYALLSTASTATAPLFDALLASAMGASSVVFQDTVQASPAPTTTSFGVTNASTLKPGNMVAVNLGGSNGWQMRPISSIASNTLTFGIPFSVAPAAAGAVQAVIYNLGDALKFLTIVDWLRDDTLAVSSLARMAVDALVNSLTLDTSANVVGLSASGPSSYVVEEQSPAQSTYSGTFPTLPSIPTNLTTAFSPESPFYSGEVYLDTTLITAYTVKMMLDNGAKQLPVPFGSEFSDGVVLGQRKVNFDLEVDGNSANYAYQLDAEQKNPHAVFYHTGKTQGQFIGVYMPKMFLALNDYNKGDVTVRLNFSNSLASAGSAGADSELCICVA